MLHTHMTHSHDSALVILSIIIAILASFTALDLAGRVTAAQGRSRFNWLMGGAVAMGIGIWSMHFTAMLAFRLPVPILYDIPTVLLSLLVAVVASGIALFIVSRPQMQWIQLVVGGSVMGAAIASMHYVGMAAVRLNATLTYDPFLFVLSIIIAVIASIAALWLAFKFRNASTLVWNWFKISSAVVMGGAISGMHFVGMLAAHFEPTSEIIGDTTYAINISLLGTIVIVFSTFIVLGLALLLSLIDQRLAEQATYLTQSELRHNETLEELNQVLRNRVAGLQLMGDVSRSVLSILDIDKLAYEIVNQIRTTFNYYHVHIYLLDDRKENLTVAAGTGSAGAEMLAKGHHISLNAPTSLVARAARTREAVQVDNVREAVDWLPNPLLPDTYSEMAVPIILESQIIGVLDVQQDVIGGLDEGDADLLRSLANQVAIAIRNAQIFAQTETALTEAKALQERYIEQAWETRQQQELEYNYHRAGASMQDETSQSKASTMFSVTPIRLQSQVIGTIHLYQADQTRKPLTEQQRAFVQAVADQVAQTAENLRLFDETRQRAVQEQTIREITDKVRAAPNLDALLEVAARELSDRLDVPHTVVAVGIDGDLPS